MVDISGWYESEYGVNFIEVNGAKDVQDLATMLFLDYDTDCIGVDMELEGFYTTGLEVDDVALMIELENRYGENT